MFSPEVIIHSMDHDFVIKTIVLLYCYLNGKQITYQELGTAKRRARTADVQSLRGRCITLLSDIVGVSQPLATPSASPHCFALFSKSDQKRRVTDRGRLSPFAISRRNYYCIVSLLCRYCRHRDALSVPYCPSSGRSAEDPLPSVLDPATAT